MQRQTDGHNFDVPVPQILKDIVEGERLVPQEHVQQPTEGHHFPCATFLKDIVEVASVVPPRRCACVSEFASC